MHVDAQRHVVPLSQRETSPEDRCREHPERDEKAEQVEAAGRCGAVARAR